MTFTNQQKLVKILQSMTLKEKISQMLQLLPSFFMLDSKETVSGPMQEMGLDDEILFNTGSIIGSPGAAKMMDIQKSFMERNRNRIPLMFMADVVHGFRTIFPIPLAMASTWEPELIEEASSIAALEAAVSGVHATFSPMVDLTRDARWGRVMEGSGEDTWLNSHYSRAYVRGYQGGDLTDKERIASCVKHFAAYGAPEGGRDYNTVDMSERTLREYYLPAYKEAVDEGCAMVMTSFNIIDGIPATGNYWLLRDILRKEWGFNGVLISDWGAVAEVLVHGAAEDMGEAVEKVLMAGVDIEMMTSGYVNLLERLVAERRVEEAWIDEAVMRILKLKYKLGLFDNPYRAADPQKESEILLCKSHRKAARLIGAKSVVLLKNEGVLPISKLISSIAIIGPFTESKRVIGSWSCEGRVDESVSLLEGIANKIGREKVITCCGCTVEGGDLDACSAVEAASKADIVILALGEDQDMSGEGASRAFLNIPGRQRELAEAVFELGKPTIAVVFNGRPIELGWLNEKASAVVEAWFPGTETGNALADILFGDINPSGKLTISFPRTVGQVPIYYNHFNTGRPKRGENDINRYCSKYIDIPNTPLYPFGYGLSYTTFDYSDFTLSSVKMRRCNTIEARVTVTNKGCYAGEEIVQLYIQDLNGSVVRPVKELKGYKKIHLQPGEAVSVYFTIKEDMLKFHNSDMVYKTEPGYFKAYVGPNSAELLEALFELR